MILNGYPTSFIEKELKRFRKWKVTYDSNKDQTEDKAKLLLYYTHEWRRNQTHC